MVVYDYEGRKQRILEGRLQGCQVCLHLYRRATRKNVWLQGKVGVKDLQGVCMRGKKKNHREKTLGLQNQGHLHLGVGVCTDADWGAKMTTKAEVWSSRKVWDRGSSRNVYNCAHVLWGKRQACLL